MTQRPNDPNSHIEIGAVRTDELESLLALICEVFQLPYEPARELFYKDPYLNLGNKRVLRVNGRIVSCLTIADREVWLGNATVRVGGIAGVATHPNERNKGYASLLLEDTLAYLKTQDYALSALIPYSAHFYRRFGYEICGNACRLITAPSYLPHSRELRNVRPARPDDVEKISDCYYNWAAHLLFFGVRDQQRWQYLLQNVPQCYVYHEEPEEISGYLLTELRNNLPAFDGEVPMPTLRVLEFIATSTPARRGLIAHLAAQTNAGMIEFSMPSDLLWISDDLIGMGIGEEVLANIEVVPMLMTRVLNFRPLIDVNLEYVSWHGGLRLELRDSTNSNSPESWTVLREPDAQIVRHSLDSDFAFPCLSGDIRVWAQVTTGFKGADDAEAQGLLFASDETAIKRGKQLFPDGNGSPFLPIPDHF